MAAFGGWRLTRTGALFVIGIVVLAGLVTGGIFLVKNRGEAVRRDEAVKIAEQKLKDQSGVATPVTPTATEETNNNSTDVPMDGSVAGVFVTEADNSGKDAAQLPETGPNDLQAISRIMIVAVLALSVAFYVSSRRKADSL